MSPRFRPTSAPRCQAFAVCAGSQGRLWGRLAGEARTRMRCGAARSYEVSRGPRRTEGWESWRRVNPDRYLDRRWCSAPDWNMAIYMLSACATPSANPLAAAGPIAQNLRARVRARSARDAACQLAVRYVDLGMSVEWSARRSASLGRFGRHWRGRFVPELGDDGDAGVRERRRPVPPLGLTDRSRRLAFPPPQAP